MKETTPIPADTIEHIQPAQHAKQPQLIHRMHPHKGQKVYQFNPRENTLQVVTISQPATASYTLAAQGKLSPIRKRVEANPDCFYIAALNTKNAIKKIRRIALNGFLLFPNANPEIINP